MPFAVRMGLHTGEATERDGSYVGPSVNRAARLMALAHGGQVVASDTTEVLLRDRVALRPLGEHRLRGLRGRTARVPGASPTDCASTSRCSAASIASRGNLPQQLNSFVGREDLVAEVAELVRSNRLVTLSGVGGVGKTRLAVEVGAELAGELPDGVWMVELAPVGEPSSVPGGHRDRAGHHPARRRGADRHRRRGARRPAAVARRRQLRARGGRGGVGDQRDPRSIRQRQRPRHVARVPLGRRRDAPVGVAARPRGRRGLGCGHAVRRPGSRRPRRLRAPRSEDGRGGDRDLRDARRASAGDRAGGGADGGDERERGQG